MTPRLSIGIVSLEPDGDLDLTLNSLGKVPETVEILIQASRMGDAQVQFLHDLRNRLVMSERISTHQIHTLPVGDSGIFSAMNKIRCAANGDFLWYLNAGDKKFANISLASIISLLDRSTCYGFQTAQVNNSDCFIRPGRNDMNPRFSEIGHQSSIYPRAAYQAVAYDESLSLSADRQYNQDCEKQTGWQYVPRLISVFSLGGESNTFEWHLVGKHRHETLTLQAKFLLKVILNKLIGPDRLWRILARNKYDRINRDELKKMTNAE